MVAFWLAMRVNPALPLGQMVGLALVMPGAAVTVSPASGPLVIVAVRGRVPPVRSTVKVKLLVVVVRLVLRQVMLPVPVMVAWHRRADAVAVPVAVKVLAVRLDAEPLGETQKVVAPSARAARSPALPKVNWKAMSQTRSTVGTRVGTAG